MNTIGSLVLSSPPLLNRTASFRFCVNGKPLWLPSTTSHEPKQHVDCICECWSWITKTPELGPSGGGCVSSEGFLLYSDKRLVMYIFTGYMLGIGEKLGSYRLKKLVVQQLIKATWLILDGTLYEISRKLNPSLIGNDIWPYPNITSSSVSTII